MWSPDVRRGQKGQALLEGLLSVFLAGTIVITLLTLLFTIIVSSAHQRGVVLASNEATTIAEHVERLAYIPCGGGVPVDYSEASDGIRSNFSAQLTYEYLTPPEAGSAASFGACPAAGDQGVQKVIIDVKMDVSPGASTTLEFLKRSRECPPGATVIAGQEC